MSLIYKNNLISFVLLDVAAIIFVSLIFFLTSFEILPRNKAGFYCNDTKYSFKYVGDTVTPVAVMLLSGLVPILLVFVSETSIYLLHYKRFEKKTYFKWIKMTIIWYKEFIIASLLNVSITFVFKFVAGEPRPHFFDTCEPSGCSNHSEILYVTHYECMTKKYSGTIVQDSTMSFLSGHSSFSVYSSLFLFWYIQTRISAYSPRFITMLLQIGAIAIGITCSYTRITDHRHHWWDVACGSLLGAIMAVYAIKSCNKFAFPSLNESQPLICENKRSTNDHHVVELN